jgi:hypothetical protein
MKYSCQKTEPAPYQAFVSNHQFMENKKKQKELLVITRGCNQQSPECGKFLQKSVSQQNKKAENLQIK